MKAFKITTLFSALLIFAVSLTQAAELASAKVLAVAGKASLQAEDGTLTPISRGAILKQDDIIVTEFDAAVDLVFSNGSMLTVEENTALTIKELTQEDFKGDKTYEKLKADPSKSQTLLVLEYGNISGHVKKLRDGSKFDIETSLGTAAIRGTQFNVGLNISVGGQLVFSVTNIDGVIEGATVDPATGLLGDFGPVAPGTSLALPIPAGSPLAVGIIALVQSTFPTITVEFADPDAPLNDPVDIKLEILPEREDISPSAE